MCSSDLVWIRTRKRPRIENLFYSILLKRKIFASVFSHTLIQDSPSKTSFLTSNDPYWWIQLNRCQTEGDRPKTVELYLFINYYIVFDSTRGTIMKVKEEFEELKKER